MLISASDSVGAALSVALDGLALRQNVVADNVANIDTPGYRAATVDFETSLRSALSGRGVREGDLTPAVGTSTRPPGVNGNNVDLSTETMTGLQATFQYQLLSRAAGDRFSLVTTAIGGM